MHIEQLVKRFRWYYIYRGWNLFELLVTAGALGTLLLAVMAPVGWAGTMQKAREIPLDLTELSLEDLMNIEVTSVSKKAEKLSEATAAIFVITQEDLRQSGVTSIPEALRMVPGLQVARIDANKWAITSRGFNSRFANKLLVLIDGRSVYTPIFSGVYWDMYDVLLEDVERIEVIRGPGATLWGANAVNGIISIITKNARDTRGGLVTLGGGSEERGFGGVRYGGKLGDDVYYRVYAKYFNRDHFVWASGEEAADAWDVLRGGFRMDWEASGSNLLTLQGDVYDGDAGQTFSFVTSLEPPYMRMLEFDAPIAGGYALGRWEHIFSDASDMALQLYYDRFEREEAIVEGLVNTFDLDFQHRFMLGQWQEIVWGLGYRFISDESDSTFTLSFDPKSRDYDLFSAFVQDEITLAQGRLRLMLGSKFEHNDYTGSEIQPNARLLWMPHERHTGWAAVSRAVRTPNRVSDDVRLQGMYGTPPALMVMFGDRDVESEELLAYELGYRVRPTDRLFLDMATFYNIYDELETVEPGTPYFETSPAPGYLVVPVFADNKMDGETYGVELAADWRVLNWWRLRAAYAYLQMQLRLDENSGDVWSESMEGRSPRHQFSLLSSMNLPGRLELDLGNRYVDNLPYLDVKSYFSMDVRLGWNVLDNLEVSIVGQNLLDSHHSEFTPQDYTTLPVDLPIEVERGVYGKITCRF